MRTRQAEMKEAGVVNNNNNNNIPVVERSNR